MSFSQAVDRIFNDGVMSTPVTYERADGETISVRVIFYTPEPEFSGQDGSINVESNACDVRKSEIDQASSGDKIITACGIFTIASASLDELGLVWRMGLDELI